MSELPTVLYEHKRADAQLLEWDMTMHASAIRAAVCSIEGKLERRPTLPSMYGKEAHMQRNHAFFCAPGAAAPNTAQISPLYIKSDIHGSYPRPHNINKSIQYSF